MQEKSDNVYSLSEFREFKKLQATLEEQLSEVQKLRAQLTDQMVTAQRLNMIHDYE